MAPAPRTVAQTAGVAETTALSLVWFSVDGGGGSIQNGPLRLHGVVGQADAGRLSNGALVLTGGFLQADLTPATKLYLPQLRR